MAQHSTPRVHQMLGNTKDHSEPRQGSCKSFHSSLTFCMHENVDRLCSKIGMLVQTEFEIQYLRILVLEERSYTENLYQNLKNKTVVHTPTEYLLLTSEPECVFM